MDSKVINKLIRSEVWPILREQGFSHFESRNAFAYHGPFVNVVNFQSFSSQLAAGLRCTTYSFCVNLGVYLIGSPWEGRFKRDKSGLIRPPEYGCSLRSQLRKRVPLDGFEREEIFYIDPNGRTTAHCFDEVRYLLREVATGWFSRHNDIEGLISVIEGVDGIYSRSDISTSGSPGSYSWNQLHSQLSLLRHAQSPSQLSANIAVDTIERAIGSVLDFSTIVTERSSEERYAREIGTLWDKLGEFKPVPEYNPGTTSLHSSLVGPAWSPVTVFPEVSDRPPEPAPVVSARKQLWPILKGAGFTQFTDRLAHRISKHCVEVVEVLPMDRFERKSWKLPEGLFRVGVGVFWPPLLFNGFARTNRKGDSRPTVNECHISNWLTPEILTHRYAGTAYGSIEDASAGIAAGGLRWLEAASGIDSALELLQQRDCELFWHYPMMRSYGASFSSRRLLYIAYLKLLKGEYSESAEYIRRAEAALLTRYPAHLRELHREWIDQVKGRLSSL